MHEKTNQEKLRKCLTEEATTAAATNEEEHQDNYFHLL